MRKLILSRITELKFRNNNFDPAYMKWSKFKYLDVHISELNFNKLRNVELLDLFERILFKIAKQY